MRSPGTGPVGSRPYERGAEPNLTNTPKAVRDRSRCASRASICGIENVATPGLTIADREGARTGGLPPGVLDADSLHELVGPNRRRSWRRRCVSAHNSSCGRTCVQHASWCSRPRRCTVFRFCNDADRSRIAPSIILVTATTRVTGFSHFRAGSPRSAPPDFLMAWFRARRTARSGASISRSASCRRIQRPSPAPAAPVAVSPSSSRSTIRHRRHGSL